MSLSLVIFSLEAVQLQASRAITLTLRIKVKVQNIGSILIAINKARNAGYVSQEVGHEAEISCDFYSWA